MKSDTENPIKTPQETFTVSSLNRLAKSLLENHLGYILVEGEISNLAKPASGHWYLTLKDSKAQIRCAMFAGNNRRVSFQVENGQQVKLSGRISLYEGRGEYQLIINTMEQYGTGDLQKQYEVLKLKLKECGLFDSERKKAMHTRYKHIGLITSQSGSALQDMISVFRNRLPITTLTLIPASVQGENAPSELISAIEHANKIASTVGIEALIVGRGGGSIEDLQAFNNEDLAFAIDASELPICSAVGHEIDFTIADLVADLRAPTPSAAAEMLSRDKDEYSISFKQYHNKLERLIEQYIKTKLISLNAFQQRLKQPRRKLSESAQQVDYFESQLIRLTTSRIKETRGILNGAQRNLLSNSPQQILKRISLQVSDIRRRFELISEVEINKRKINLAQLTRSLNGVSPLNTLARGYSITTIGEERVVRNTSNLNIGDQICTRLNRGRVISTIETIQNNSDTRKSK